jgi:predicted ATPase
VSIFSRLYLDNLRPYAIFFDEPELSLSIEWQKKLLQDIVDSDKCAFLLAATHSPFIFENHLAKHADVLKVEYIESDSIVDDEEKEEDEHE